MRAPSYEADFYSDAFIRDPWLHYRAMRALAPVVWLPQYGNYALTRHRQVGEALRDPETFQSGRGVAADKTACDMMQGNSIASDGARHTAIRFAMAGPLLPGALEDVRPLIEMLAEELIERLMRQGIFDAMSDLAAHLPLTVVRDLVGLPDFGKENMLKWGAAAFDLLGVQNARGRRALDIFQEQRAFIREHATREALKEESWTRRIHELVDQGALSAELAPFCIRDYINPSLDTTISATGQLIWQLARHPEQWALLRQRPELVANTVNEAVRLGSPIRSFSRHTTRPVEIEGYEIEQGARVMVLYASANRDERVFDNPDTFDITRNPKQHLGFGSGIHMCVGMHLAQMEMGALLRAMIPRVAKITAAEPTVALNNTIYAFKSMAARFEASRGTETVERAGHLGLRAEVRGELAGGKREQTFGPVAARQDRLGGSGRLIAARVVERRDVAENVVSLVLAAADGSAPLPAWEPGAHIDVHIHPGLVRQYSLTGRAEAGTYRVAVQKEPLSSGGSVAMHAKYRAGTAIQIGRPRNNFPLHGGDSHALLFSGGIGMTPLFAMAWRLHESGRPFTWHISARTRPRLPFATELAAAPFRESITLHLDSETDCPPFDADAILHSAVADVHVYICGPAGYMAAVENAARRLGLALDRLHKEHFGAEIDVTGEPFTVLAALSGKSIEVGPAETILAALQRNGIEVDTSCRNGVCGTCLTDVVEGRPDHRDMVLTDVEKAANDRIAVCCSRSKTKVLKLRI